MQEGSKYDLILMDIIMPSLDGVSACSVIRRFDNTPIIAMTSNIRSSDIDLYFQNGAFYLFFFLFFSFRFIYIYISPHRTTSNLLSRYERRSSETFHTTESS